MPNNQKPNSLPDIVEQSMSDSRLILKLRINHDIRYFEGHFDEMPVLPGVVQLNWAIEYAVKYFEIDFNLVSVDVLKFQKLLLPDSDVTLTIHMKTAQKFEFCFYNGDDVYSSGRIVSG